ncbi:MAG: hypothetical protein DWQ01_14685 [Planctomycetota bacterium]|nr:MAG: hypothetical protein DWQ01_14685 [Planctomycetota bacterium]
MWRGRPCHRKSWSLALAGLLLAALPACNGEPAGGPSQTQTVAGEGAESAVPVSPGSGNRNLQPQRLLWSTELEDAKVVVLAQPDLQDPGRWRFSQGPGSQWEVSQPRLSGGRLGLDFRLGRGLEARRLRFDAPFPPATLEFLEGRLLDGARSKTIRLHLVSNQG